MAHYGLLEMLAFIGSRLLKEMAVPNAENLQMPGCRCDPDGYSLRRKVSK